ncbi:uncharacterized protein LOC131063154 isoform X2 [Cryptomeria japonica]|uniref:uncharacterized protein LOC131063154 isoform X2 n=1 Tax=Cryptomeria japonica TaxID=3369 RepID=UPI0027D9F71A|nr:uncharacterized protein LOC131063154 isoform X2 [Cryptomeria japonica]
MSRQQRKKTRADKLPEIVDFRFLQFHATKIPNDWDKLVVSVISVETGKAIARTNKAIVRGGNCKWLEDVSESVRFLQDDNSRELEEKLYKFVVSMGSARLGILGEATVNLADYLNSKELIWIKLPLKKCNHGTILHVKIQCVTPRSGFRESEISSTTVKEQAEQISVFDGEDDRSEGSVRSQRSFNGTSKSTLQQRESKYQDADYLAGTLRHGLNSLELSADSATNRNSKGFAPGDQASPSSTRHSVHRRQHSAGPQDGIEKYKAGNGIEQYRGRVFGGKDSGTVEYPQNRSFDRATLGSHESIQDGLQNGNKSSLVGGLAIGSGSSNEFLEAAEVTIQELRKESMMWERKAQKYILETDTLKQQLAEQQRQHKEIEMQFLATQAERDSFKQEVEQLQSALQDYIESEKGADNAKFEVQDAKRMVKEFEDEIKLHKESNANLSLQLSKIQEANTELVFALQDLEETVEQQNVEIEKLMEARERYHEADTSKQESKDMRHYAELGIKFSDIVVERDNLKKEVEQLRSVVEHGIYNIEAIESNVKDAVPESQEHIKKEEFNENTSLNGQTSLLSYQQFSPTVPEIDEQMIDQNSETAEWMQKLSYQKEEMRTLKNKLPSFPSNHSLREVTECIDESQQDLHQNLKTLKQYMNELERDCKELTDENLELIYNLNELKNNLESKNAYIAELEEKLSAPSSESSLPGSKPLYSTELTSMDMSLHNSPSQVIRVQNDGPNLDNILNTFKERIHELESELENAHEKTAKMEQMLAASLIDSQATKIVQQLARPIQKDQILKLKDTDRRIFVDGLPAPVTHLNEKVEASEHLHRIELANMEKSLTEYQSQVLAMEGQKLELESNYHSLVLELESQKLELECVLDILKNRVCSLQSEVITTQQETIEREIQLTVNYESRIEDTAAQAGKEVANALQLVQTLEEDKSKHMIHTKTLNDHLTNLEQKLKRSTDLARVEIASKEKLLSDFQHQVIDLQNQNHGLQDELSVLKEKIRDRESEIQTAEQEKLKREEDLTAGYEHKLQRNEARAIRAENDLANSLERVRSFESHNVKDAIMIDDFKMQVSQLQKELKSSEDVHNTELVSFQNQVTKLQSENTIFENKITMLREKICELENESQKAQQAQQEAIEREQEIASIEKVLSHFQQQAIDFQNQNNNLQAEINVFKERIYDLESEVQTAELENVEREKELIAAYEFKLERTDARVIRAETDLTDSLEKIKYFESSSAKDTIIIDELKVQVNQLQQELKSSEDVHTTQLAGLEKSLSEFHNQVKKLQSENGILENNVKMLKEKICELEYVAQRVQQEGIDKVNDLTAAHEYRLQAIEARAREAEEELAQVLKSIIESDNEKHKMGEIISKQQNQVKAIEDQTAKIQDELATSLKTIIDLEADKARISLELSNECQRRQNSENATSSLDQLNQELQTKIQNIENKYLENNLQLNQLKEASLDQKKQLDSQSLIEKCLQENIKELEIVKMKLHSEIENLQQEVRFSKSCIQDLNSQLSALTVELQSLRCSNQNLDIQATKLQMENIGLEEKLDAAQKESKSASDRLENLGKLLEQLRADAESNLLAKTNLEKRAMELEHIKEEFENQLKEKEEKISHLFKQVHSLEMQLKISEEERDFFRLDLEVAKATCFDLQAEMKTVELNLKEENVKLLQALDESQSKLSATVEEVDSCEREQQLLQCTLGNLKREHTAAMELNSKLKAKCFNLFESQSNVEQRLQKMTGDISISLNQIKSLESDLSIMQRNVEGERGIWAPKSEAYQLNTSEYEEKCIKVDKIVGQLYPENENVVENLQKEVQNLSRQVYLVLEEKEMILTEALIEASGLRKEKKNLEDSLRLQLANVEQSEAELLQVKHKCGSEVQELKLEVEIARKKGEGLHFNLANVHRQLEDSKVRETDLQEKVQGIELKVVAVEHDKQKLKAENTSLREKVDQLLSLNAENNGTEIEKQKLKIENDSLRGQITQLMGLKAETDALQNIVEQVRDEKTTLQQSLNSTEAKLERLKTENVLLMEQLAATKQRLVEVDKLTQRNAELQERILGLQAELNAKEVEHKSKSVQIQNLSDHFQWELHDLEEENGKFKSKANSMGNDMQTKVNNISTSKEIFLGSSDCEVRCTSPPQDADTDQSTKLIDRIGALQSELETCIKQFEEKEETLITEIQKLEETNHQLMQTKLDSDTDQLQIEFLTAGAKCSCSCPSKLWTNRSDS